MSDRDGRDIEPTSDEAEAGAYIPRGTDEHTQDPSDPRGEPAEAGRATPEREQRPRRDGSATRE